MPYFDLALSVDKPKFENLTICIVFDGKKWTAYNKLPLMMYLNFEVSNGQKERHATHISSFTRAVMKEFRPFRCSRRGTQPHCLKRLNSIAERRWQMRRPLPLSPPAVKYLAMAGTGPHGFSWYPEHEPVGPGRK